ncbi:MAG: diacylglycerol/lipid kinase family protein [Aeromicrobium sp.]
MITNADAGNANRVGIGSALAVLRVSCEVEVAASRDSGELEQILRQAGDRTIVVAGGDGSLHAVIAALHAKDDLSGRTLALLPLGTGNDFARALDLPMDPEAAAQAILSGAPRPIDVIVEDNGEVVVNSVHAGASVHASKTAAKWKSRLTPVGLGVLGYPIGAALTAINPPSVHLTVDVDGEVIVRPDRRLLMVVIGNGSSVGGGAELTPAADPGDGYADVVVSLAAGPFARFAYAWRVKSGSHRARTDVITRRAKNISVRGEMFLVSADGEILGPRDARTWHVLPSAYKIVAPTR